MTLAMAIVADIVVAARARPLPGLHPDGVRGRQRRRARCSAACSPSTSWRWVFYVNLPIGAARAALICATLHAAGGEREPRADRLAGAALLAGALTCLLLVTTWGGREYAWDSAEIARPGRRGGRAARRLRRQERRAAEPILPLRLFREPVFAVVSRRAVPRPRCAFFAVIVFMPVFLQVATGATPTESGLLLLPLLLAATRRARRRRAA